MGFESKFKVRNNVSYEMTVSYDLSFVIQKYHFTQIPVTELPLETAKYPHIETWKFFSQTEHRAKLNFTLQ